MNYHCAVKGANTETPIREKRIISSVASGTASTAEKLRSANPYVRLFRRKQHLPRPARRALKKANLPRHGCTFAQTFQQLFANVLRYTRNCSISYENVTDLLVSFVEIATIFRKRCFLTSFPFFARKSKHDSSTLIFTPLPKRA